jgi:hypothetical protein
MAARGATPKSLSGFIARLRLPWRSRRPWPRRGAGGGRLGFRPRFILDSPGPSCSSRSARSRASRSGHGSRMPEQAERDAS